MKKVLKAGKKPLSLLLAVVMLITTWVFVAPTKAEAVNAGTYKYKVTFEVTDDMDNCQMKWYLYGRTDNGTGDTDTQIASGGWTSDKATGTQTHTLMEGTTSAGVFPTMVKLTDNNGAKYWNPGRSVGGKIHLYVGKDSADQELNLNGKIVKNDVDKLETGNGKGAWFYWNVSANVIWGKANYFDVRYSIDSSAHPTATSVGWDSSQIVKKNNVEYLKDETLKVPTSTTDKAVLDKLVNFKILDQYGVSMSTTSLDNSHLKTPATPVITSSSSTTAYSPRITQCTTTASNAYWYYGLSTSDATWNKLTLHMNNAMKQKNNTANTSIDSQTISVQIKAGTKTLTNGTKTFTLYDPEYSIKFDANGGEMTSTDTVRQVYSKLGFEPDASWEGYDLIGFYKDKLGISYETNLADGKTAITKDTYVETATTTPETYYAAWQAKRNAVKFSYMTADGTYTTTAPVYGYYGRDNIAVPQAVDAPQASNQIPKTITINDGDTVYTFTGWDNGLAQDAATVAVQTGDEITYTAQYSVHNEYAKYDKVKTQIDRAELADDEEDFNDKYTDESLAAFNKALDEAREIYKEETENRKRFASQQNFVDGYATRLSDAIEGLKVKHFTVLFVDDDGTIIKNGYHYVAYGERIDVPTTPVREPDETYHYEFSEWRTADRLESAEVQAALEKVTADYRFVAKFNRFTHDYSGKPEVIESTCTVNGSLKYTCPGCGMTKVVANPDDIASHDFSRQVVVEATCSTNGATAMVCKDCGVYEEGTLEIVDKLGHTFGAWTTLTPATCWGKGTERRDCANCDAYEVRETAKLDHAWDRDAEGADENGWVNVAATCEADGYKYRTCTACQLVQREKTTDKLDHPAANRVVDEVVATCKNAGYRLETCDLCGKVISFTTTDQLTTHTWDTTVTGADANGWVTVIAKSCTQKEVKKRACSVCGKEEVSISADFLSHTEIKDAAVAATCTHTGLTEGKHCDVCKQVLEAQTETPALGHNYDSAWTTESEATCQSNGYEVQICDRDGCGEILDTRVIDAIDHVWDYADDAERWEEVKAATCTEDGLEKRTCTATTGHPHEETRVIPKTGHNMGTTVHAPTCTAYGYTEYGCLNDCDLESYQSDFVAPLGHEWNDGVITKEATCTTNGVKTYTCKRGGCGATKTEVIPNLGGHNYVEDSAQYVEATNTQNGKRVYVCNHVIGTDADGNDILCGDVKEVIIPAQGHEFELVNTDPATCTANGTEYYDCKTHTGNKDCGLEYTNVIPALGHNMVLDLDQSSEPTCTKDGENVFVCSRCGYVEKVTVPKLGHDLKFVKKVPVSCQEYGYDLYECSRCGVQVKIFDMSVKPSNDHHWTEIQYHVDPTCEERGFDVITCRVCGASYRDNFVAPLGHAWDEGHHVDPTCTKPGGTLYTCTRSHTDVDKDGNPITTKCSATKLEDEEPALGHDMGQWYFAADGDHYVNKRDCNREGCPYSEYEEINGEKVVYYKVDFVSYKYVGEYYTAGDGTKLAYSMDEQPDAYDEVIVDTQYIKSGEKAEYTGKLELPKTKAFGVYNLTGWKLDKGDLSNVTTNITAKAQFQGEEIYYEVNFYSYDGHLVKGPVHVLHGHPVAKDDRPFDEYVTRPNNNQYKYEFTGKWDKDIEAIYSTGPIHAVFKQIPLTYKVVFHDWDGKVITSQILGYGEGVNESNKIIFDNMKPRKEDDAYIYEWTPASRRWVDAKGNIIDENHVKVPDNQGYQEYTPEKEKDEFLSDREKGIFHVYASYPQKVKYYRFNVSAKYADGSIAEGATVTVQSPDGQLVYTTKLNEKGTATVTVEHYEYVTVNITGGGETNSLKIGLGKDNIVDGYFGNEGDEIPSFAFELSNYVDPDPDHGGSTKCRCICHTFLGGLWINFLNILYRLFGKKTVCCHDMYEKHGDRLAYGK